jgi:hypothetical protein
VRVRMVGEGIVGVSPNQLYMCKDVVRLPIDVGGRYFDMGEVLQPGRVNRLYRSKLRIKRQPSRHAERTCRRITKSNLSKEYF